MSNFAAPCFTSLRILVEVLHDEQIDHFIIISVPEVNVIQLK